MDFMWNIFSSLSESNQQTLHDCLYCLSIVDIGLQTHRQEYNV